MCAVDEAADQLNATSSVTLRAASEDPLITNESVLASLSVKKIKGIANYWTEW